MPVHNGERYLGLAIDSVLRQTFDRFELVVVDDCSGDRTAAILSAYGSTDPRVRVLRNEVNLGVAQALNRGIAQCRAPWIARMDADDIALPSRLANQWAHLAARPSVVALGTQVRLIDEVGDWVHAGLYFPKDHASIERALLCGEWPLVHPTTFLRRDALERIGGYSNLKCEDHDLFLRLAEIGQLENLGEVHLHYRRHFGSAVMQLITDGDESKEAAIREACSRRGIAYPVVVPPHRPAGMRMSWAFEASMITSSLMGIARGKPDSSKKLRIGVALLRRRSERAIAGLAKRMINRHWRR